MKVAKPEASLIKQRIVPQHQRMTSLRMKKPIMVSAFIIKKGTTIIIAQFKKLSINFLCIKAHRQFEIAGCL